MLLREHTFSCRVCRKRYENGCCVRIATAAYTPRNPRFSYVCLACVDKAVDAQRKAVQFSMADVG